MTKILPTKKLHKCVFWSKPCSKVILSVKSLKIRPGKTFNLNVTTAQGLGVEPKRTHVKRLNQIYQKLYLTPADFSRGSPVTVQKNNKAPDLKEWSWRHSAGKPIEWSRTGSTRAGRQSGQWLWFSGRAVGIKLPLVFYSTNSLMDFK